MTVRPRPSRLIEMEHEPGEVAQLTLDRERREARIAVRVEAIDVKVADPLRRLVDEVAGAGVDRLELDLGHVSFADSSLVRLALRAKEALAPAGAKIVIKGAPQVLRLFDLTGTAQLFEIVPAE